MRLRLAVTRTARLLRREAGGQLTPTALSALAAIERHGPVSPARLADIESVKRPTVTRVAAYLADEGMIGRRPDAGDGRSVLLEITDQGRLYLAERRQAKSAYLAGQLSGLPAEDVLTLSRAAEILDQLNQRRIESGPATAAERPGAGSSEAGS